MVFLKWALIVAAALLVFYLAFYAYIGFIYNPRVAQELQRDPNGERADLVMLLTLPSGQQFPVNYLQEGDLVFVGADGRWWRELGTGADVSMLIQGSARRGRAEVVLDDPGYSAEIFSRLRPTAPDWLPAWLQAKLIVITCYSTS